MRPPLFSTTNHTRPGWLQLFSPGAVEWSRICLPCPETPSLSGIRLLHLSDLHLVGVWHSAYDKLIEQINHARFDLIALTGDLIDNRWNPTAVTLAFTRRFLDALISRFGTFVIIGNHDGDLIAPHVERSRATLLHHGRVLIDFGSSVLELLGLPCVHRGDVTRRILRRFPPKQANAYRVVLSHYPDHIHKILSIEPDLVLAGHTHGGQVCLPGGRPIITHDALPLEMSVGLHDFNGSKLLISRGIGFATYPIRVFSPPQVVEVVLSADPPNTTGRE